VRPTGNLRTIKVLCQEVPILNPTPIFRSPLARRSTADGCSGRLRAATDATTSRTETFMAASVRKGNVTCGLVRSRERLSARLRFLDFNSRHLALQGPQRRYASGIAF
jgi:hypothetical protein